MPADSVHLLADDLSITDRKNVDVGNLELLAIRGRSGEETLAEQEIFWRDHQRWLEEIGYILRWRYHANWLPSWLTDPLKTKFLSEDVLSRGLRGSLLDAIQVSDGKLVALKKIDVSKNPDEVGIGCFFSSVALAASSKTNVFLSMTFFKYPAL
ncbi:hypothetical protein BDQ17DRAFT_476393 [Cyathus striatus]|nr:hypothetical protein BDQ17DRAFT_476393 [Cyathus striatus]